MVVNKSSKKYLVRKLEKEVECFYLITYKIIKKIYMPKNL